MRPSPPSASPTGACERPRRERVPLRTIVLVAVLACGCGLEPSFVCGQWLAPGGRDLALAARPSVTRSSPDGVSMTLDLRGLSPTP